MVYLPEDIKNKIYKMVFTIDVLDKIKEYVKPGDFSFMITENTHQVEIYWLYILAEDYNNINKIGQEAWNYLKKSDVYILDKNSPPILEKIYEAMSYEHSGNSFFQSLSTMEFIAKIGWAEYVKINRNTYSDNNIKAIAE